jgi:Rod binding domain-containing protein
MNIDAITSLSGSPAAALAALGAPSASASGGTPTAAATDAQRKKAAAQFEAILVRQLLSQSVGSMLGGTGHTSGMIYGDMMTDVLAQKLTAGQGLGLGRMIEKQLAPPGTHAAAKPALSKLSP